MKTRSPKMAMGKPITPGPVSALLLAVGIVLTVIHGWAQRDLNRDVMRGTGFPIG